MSANHPVQIAPEAGQDLTAPVHCLIEAVLNDPSIDLQEFCTSTRCLIRTADADLFRGVVFFTLV